MKSSPLTLDIQIASELKYMIENGFYKYGQKLPSERELCKTFNVQRMTVRSALDILIHEDYICASPKRGYFVMPERRIMSVRQLTLMAQHYESDMPLNSSLIEFKKVRSDISLSDRLLLPRGSSVYKIVKLYIEGAQPLFFNTVYIPEDLVSGLTRSAAASSSPSALLKTCCSHTPEKTKQKITRIYADEYTSSLMHVPLQSPLLKYKVSVFGGSGRMLLFFEAVMRYELLTFVKEALFNES